MLKKDITFEDLDGKSVTKTYYFNISKSELMDLELSSPGGFSERLKFLMQTEDVSGALSVFKLIIDLSIGERSEDNIRFMKSAEISAAFKQTNAYDEMLFEFVKNPKAAADFIVAIVPSDFRDKIDPDKILAEAQAAVEARHGVIDVELPKTDITVYTDVELANMPLDKLQQLMREYKGDLPKNVLVVAMQRVSAGR